MDRATFSAHLTKASEVALNFARGLVANRLPGEVRYKIRDYAETLSAEATVELLYASGEVPVWIDISAHSTDYVITLLQIQYSNRRTARDESLRYKQYGYPPFQCLSPRIPSGCVHDKPREIFDINWHLRRRDALNE